MIQHTSTAVAAQELGNIAVQAGPLKELLVWSNIQLDRSRNNKSSTPRWCTKIDKLGVFQGQLFGPLHSGAIIATSRNHNLGLHTAAPSKASSAIIATVTPPNNIARD